MKKAIIVLTILALAFLLGWRVVQTQKLRREALQKPQAEKTIAVGVMPVERREIRESIKASGNIQALAEITVFSKVSGKIARNQAAMGDVIRPGSLLAVVNRDEIGYDFKPYEVLSEVRGVVARVLQNPGAAINPQIPLLFDHVIMRALKKVPAERYQKASDIANDLHDFVESFAQR